MPDIIDYSVASKSEIKPGVEIAFHRDYPTSLRSVFKWGWRTYVAAFFTASLLLWYFSVHDLSILQNQNRWVLFALVFLPALIFLWMVVRTIYLIFFVKRLHYGLKGGDFTIVRGIILRERGSFPLTKITDIYTDESWLDLILRLRNIHISTRSLESATFARLEGLRVHHATELREALEKYTHDARLAESQGMDFTFTNPEFHNPVEKIKVNSSF